MRTYLNTFKALSYALASGRTVWCAETGEGWQLGLASLRNAKHLASMLLRDEECITFFLMDGVK